MSGDPPARPPRLALLVRDLASGGTQRSQIGLAGALANAGWPVDLVVCSARITGSGIAPPKVRVVNLRPGARPFARLAPFLADPSGAAQLASVLLTRLRPSPTLSYLPALVRYLRRERPAGVIAASTSLNLEAIWARRLARSGTALVVSERSHRTLADREASARERRLLGMAGRYYPEADAIVAVSTAVADQLARRDGLARQAISVIHDLVAVQEVAAMAQEQLSHPWFAPGAPPVILGAGRPIEQKDFPTLIRAFAFLRARREARLVILGGRRDAIRSGRSLAELNALAQSLGVAADVELHGPEANPYRYMARAAAFVLSSRWEGFGHVLVEAMACGCPVVSTDCPSGPSEILAGGRWGPLVRVGDAVGLAAAIGRTLDAPPLPASLIARAADFSPGHAVAAYLDLLLPGGSAPSPAGGP